MPEINTRPSTVGTVGVAMSGGVDSTVVAATLLEQGFSVRGFFMKLPLPGLDKQIEKVQLVADRLGIPLHFVEMGEMFNKRIINYFCTEYRLGRTPNPCVVCNQEIKFGLLIQAMRAQGVDRIATGHYAGICQINGRFFLRRGDDPKKDQSYFLCRLSSQQLQQVFFPLAEQCKTDIFRRAQDLGFTQFSGEESQDVCFMAQHDLTSFLLEQGLSSEQGEIVSTEGEVLGTHQGIWKYTVGQRRGLGIPDATPWYVVGLDAEKNQVLVGKNEELFHRELRLSRMQWQLDEPRSWQGKVQLRSRHRAAPAEVLPETDGNWRVCFDEPQRAVTPGQFAVLYQDDMVVGSGIIT
ncbi:MAG: tRNA 2-thiouridine(34) synthase MnmA [Candidatus Electrothrix sp. AUS4]|nr:tRNA 2-thiouridine(34) synthase MnmA [Candidatus Electrothrix sp. AUS4]